MKLQAGQLSMLYENGFLRHIMIGGSEVLQMIYFGIRDPEWNTIPSTISKEEITQTADSFHIGYHRLFTAGAIQMQWRVQIRGTANSTIHFGITGEALTDFQKNRIGICVLHPIKECSGNKVLVTHPDGTAEECIFPVPIAPHQPFKNIAALQWGSATLRFEGDIFETEDQRNWTDNSYKTYSTPLDLPFPAWIRKGERVQQRVDCSLNLNIPIPAIGIGRSSIRNNNYNTGLKILSTIGFNHYRADLHLQDPTWPTTLSEVLEESQCLQAPLELALHLPTSGAGLPEFLQNAPDPRQLKSIVLLEAGSPCISNQLLKNVLPLLRRQFPGVLIGGGTDLHFAELNRSDLITADLDFVSYPIHPQVHASDDASVMENAAAQGYSVNTGKIKYGRPIYVSPVTVQARNRSDARQQTEFAAGWTALSLRSLMEAGVSSITYFEALGEKGVASYEKEFIPFPVLRVFRSTFTVGQETSA